MYRFGGSLGAGHHEKMPLALQDVQFGTANGAAQDVGVVQPHQGVAFTGEDQRALAQAKQPQQAGPANQGGELVVIGSRVSREHAVHHTEAQQGLYRIARALLFAQGSFAPAKEIQDVGGSHQYRRAGRGRREDQPTHHAWITQGELLRQRTAPTHAEHIDPIDSQLLEHFGDQVGMAGVADASASGAFAIRPPQERPT